MLTQQCAMLCVLVALLPSSVVLCLYADCLAGAVLHTEVTRMSMLPCLQNLQSLGIVLEAAGQALPQRVQVQVQCRAAVMQPPTLCCSCLLLLPMPHANQDPHKPWRQGSQHLQPDPDAAAGVCIEAECISLLVGWRSGYIRPHALPCGYVLLQFGSEQIADMCRKRLRLVCSCVAAMHT